MSLFSSRFSPIERLYYSGTAEGYELRAQARKAKKNKDSDKDRVRLGQAANNQPVND